MAWPYMSHAKSEQSKRYSGNPGRRMPNTPSRLWVVLEGGFTEYDRFVYLPLGADAGMGKVWQETMLAFFLGKELIDQALDASLFSLRLSLKGGACPYSVPGGTQALGSKAKPDF